MNSANMRKIHLWLGIIFSFPALMIFTTGLILQVKNVSPWIQPEIKKAQGTELALSLPEILDISMAVEAAKVKSWADVAQVDWRPNTGLIRVRTKSWFEIQIDASTKEVINTGKRWTALLISLHEGSRFGQWIKYGIYFPTAIVLWTLWFSGVWIGIHKLYLKFKNKKRKSHGLV